MTRKSRRGRVSKRISFFLLINIVDDSHRCGMLLSVLLVLRFWRRQSHSMLSPWPDNGPGTQERCGRQSHRSKDGVMTDGIV